MSYRPPRLQRERIDRYASAMEGTDKEFFKAVKRRISKGYDSQEDFKADADECDRRYMAYRETLGKRR